MSRFWCESVVYYFCGTHTHSHPNSSTVQLTMKPFTQTHFFSVSLSLSLSPVSIPLFLYLSLTTLPTVLSPSAQRKLKHARCPRQPLHAFPRNPTAFKEKRQHIPDATALGLNPPPWLIGGILGIGNEEPHNRYNSCKRMGLVWRECVFGDISVGIGTECL